MRRFLTCSPLMLLWLLTSCVRDVVLDAGEKPTVAVECILSNNAPQELRLNFTKGAAKSEAEPLIDAVATLIDVTSSSIVGQFEKEEGDLWTLDYVPMQHHKYRLEVHVPGYDLIYAEDTMPRKMYVLERCYSPHKGVEDHQPKDKHPWTYYYDDWDGNAKTVVKEQYPDKYGIATFLSGSFYFIKELTGPFMVYGMNYNHSTGRHELAEEICTDHHSVLSFNLIGRNYIPPCFAEDYPKVQLYPNLEGTPLHNRYLIFPSGAVQKEPYLLISGSFTGDWWYYNRFCGTKEARNTDGYLVFATLSDTYEHYIKEAVRFQQQKESADMTAKYFNNNIYSNISGGIGIFAAKWEEKTQWDKSCWTNMMAWEKFWDDYERCIADGETWTRIGPDIDYGLEELIKQGIMSPNDL